MTLTITTLTAPASRMTAGDVTPTRRGLAGWVCLILVAMGLTGGAASAGTFGLFRSTDEGRTWLPVGSGLPRELRVDALGHSSRNRLAGTERGLYVSRDDGGSWSRPARGVSGDLKVWEFANLGPRVYCATANGVWSSMDHGQSWTPVGRRLDGTNVLSLVVVGELMFAGTDRRGVHVLRSPTGDWEEISAGLPGEAQVFQFAVRRGVLFAALYSKGIFRFDPESRIWTSRGPEWPLRLVATDDVLLSGRNPGGVFALRDEGISWNWASLGLPEFAPTWAMARVGNSVLLGTSGDSGLMRSDDSGASWMGSDQGLPAGSSAIAFGPAESSVLAVMILK